MVDGRCNFVFWYLQTSKGRLWHLFYRVSVCSHKVTHYKIFYSKSAADGPGEECQCCDVCVRWWMECRHSSLVRSSFNVYEIKLTVEYSTHSCLAILKNVLCLFVKSAIRVYPEMCRYWVRRTVMRDFALKIIFIVWKFKRIYVLPVGSLRLCYWKSFNISLCSVTLRWNTNIEMI